jgi:hypothetical protein
MKPKCCIDKKSVANLSQTVEFLKIIIVLVFAFFWGNNNRKKHEDCFTSLICMKTKYIKQIEMPTDKSPHIEWRWAKATLDIPDSQVCALDKLGINISPKSNNNNIYFEV